GGLDVWGWLVTGLVQGGRANGYCNRRKASCYGSEHRVEGYRMYTYTPAQYERMCKEAGFESVEIFGAWDGYNRQRSVYRLNDARARRVTRHIVNPPRTWKGWLVRWIADASPWYRLSEDEVVVFARKGRRTEPLVWDGLPHKGPITQFSTGDKVFLLCFSGDKPASVFKLAKSVAASERLEKEYDLLERAEASFGAEVE